MGEVTKPYLFRLYLLMKPAHEKIQEADTSI